MIHVFSHNYFYFFFFTGPKHVQNWLSYNDPKLQPKFLRYAERIGRETGVTEELQAFDNAAATFPNKPKVIAAT